MLENGPPVPPNVAFTVTLSKATTQTVTVRASTSDGSAVGGTDYEVKSGATITFTPGGPLTQTFLVPIKNDTLDEPGETFNVTLSEPSGSHDSRRRRGGHDPRRRQRQRVLDHRRVGGRAATGTATMTSR